MVVKIDAWNALRANLAGPSSQFPIEFKFAHLRRKAAVKCLAGLGINHHIAAYLVIKC